MAKNSAKAIVFQGVNWSVEVCITHAAETQENGVEIFIEGILCDIQKAEILNYVAQMNYGG